MSFRRCAYDGIARRARAELGVTGWGMQVMTLPPDWDRYPNHCPGTEEAGQDEVYIPLAGSATLVADEQRFDLRPGVMARVGPRQRRQILPGPNGIRFIALGAILGAHEPSVGPSRAPVAGSGAGVIRVRESLLAAAQRGDEHAFVEQTAPHRRALHVHAYRMLATLHDADETLGVPGDAQLHQLAASPATVSGRPSIAPTAASSPFARISHPNSCRESASIAYRCRPSRVIASSRTPFSPSLVDPATASRNMSMPSPAIS
jgi:hypothetical protein